MIKDFILIPLKELQRRKLRSLLTLIGVFIGIAAIVSLITLGQGLENAITEQFQMLGNDKLFITAKGSALTAGLSIDAVKITDDDFETIDQISGIRKVTGMIFSTASVEFNDIVRYLFVSGMPTDPEERKLIGEAQSFKIGQGRFLEKGDKNKAVVGFTYSDPNFFEKEVGVGDTILVHGHEFKVVGILQKIGSPPDDQSVQIPYETYEEIFEVENEYGFLVAQINPGEDIGKMSTKVNDELRKDRGLDEGEEDLNVETPEQLAATFTTILDIVQIVLIGIAAISLLVGGIGIMNTMYMVILQRTKEIGIMKALGAKNSHILILFLIESGFYGFFGGVVGAAIGILFAKIVEALFVVFVGPAFLSIEINFWLISGTLLFAFVVGCASGVLPAYQASKMDPVDSLRYE